MDFRVFFMMLPTDSRVEVLLLASKVFLISWRVFFFARRRLCTTSFLGTKSPPIYTSWWWGTECLPHFADGYTSFTSWSSRDQETWECRTTLCEAFPFLCLSARTTCTVVKHGFLHWVRSTYGVRFASVCRVVCPCLGVARPQMVARAEQTFT